MFKNNENERHLNFNNSLFVHDHINEDLPSNFDNIFTTSKNKQSYNARGRKNNTINKLLPNSTTYGLNSV